MYYKLKNSTDRKQIGTYYIQTKGFVDGYDIYGPNCRTKLDYDRFPNFVPDLSWKKNLN